MAPFRQLELPAIAIYALEESVDPESASTAPRELTRKLQLAIEIVVVANADVDDALDDLCAAVEKAIDADEWFGGTCAGSILASTAIGISEEGNRPTGHAVLTYAVTYRTDAPAAADLPALADFSKAHVETSLAGAQAPADRAVDDIPVPIT
jgi:hypothetical protein